VRGSNLYHTGWQTLCRMGICHQRAWGFREQRSL